MPYVLLIEDLNGELIAVKFDRLSDARDWEDANAGKFTVRGVARCLTKTGALIAVSA